MNRYYSAAIQTNFRASADGAQINKNASRMCRLIEQTVVGYKPFFDVRLFVLPEFSHQVPVYNTANELHELAVEFPNEHTDKYLKLAKKHDIFIQTGSFLEKDKKYPGHVFNTTLLISKEGVLSKYRKINTWIPWEVHTSPADLSNYTEDMFPVVDTEIGKIGVAICYDWLFPETIRELRVRGAEIINRVSAYMDPWG
ncbi:MAG: nitrilase, partial [Proteobacteria bacterium]|nr:nitrilase [Pseudomonadota bacterium]